MKILVKALKTLGILVLMLLLTLVSGVGYLWATEYQPEPIEPARLISSPNSAPIQRDRTLSLTSYNIGYAGLGEGEDFFMDGGSMVQPATAESVYNNLRGIDQELHQFQSDFYFLQEVDEESKRSYRYNQVDYLTQSLDIGHAFAYNFKVNYIPYPWPPIGKIASGLLTMSTYPIQKANRIALPVPFSWPSRMANLKRCLLVTYIPIEETSKQLVLINLHLEAYDDGEGKTEQTKQLINLMRDEIQAGNYVIAGGDWNQTLPGAAPTVKHAEVEWEPGVLNQEDIPAEWTFAVDPKIQTDRLNNQPYKGNEAEATLYSIDGFLVSPNIKIKKTEVLDTKFKYSDHRPIRLLFELKP